MTGTRLGQVPGSITYYFLVGTTGRWLALMSCRESVYLAIG